MKFMIYTHDKDDVLALRQANREAHLAHLRQESKVKTLSAGPWLDDDTDNPRA